jgi:tetratricopeptide (TPR) repeat protein
MTYLQRCVNADPEDIDCLYELGRAHNSQESYDLAQGAFLQTIELGTTDPYHFYWAGAVLTGRGDCGRAIDYLQRGYALAQEAQVANPTNAAFTTLMGDFREALSGCGVLIGPPQPEATDEPSA